MLRFSRWKVVRLLAGAMVVGSMVIAGCGDDDDDEGADATQPSGATATTTGQSTSEPSVTDATITIGVRTGPLDVNPLLRTGVLYGPMTGTMESLTALDRNAEVIPALAESWEFDDDGMGVTWTLREGVVFHNGEEFTADDVVQTWTAYQAETSTSLYRANLARVTSLDPVGDFELRMEFSEPFPEAARVFASAFMVMPGDYLNEVGSEGFSLAPIGTGPYQAKEFEIGGDWTLERFDEYWGELPPVKTIELLSIPDEAARVARLETGDLDLAEGLAPHTAEQLDGRDEFTVRSFPAILATGLRLNTLQAPLDDPLVRRAINHAIDRDALVDGVLRGRGTVGSHVCLPLAQGCPEVDPYEFNPDLARDLLAEAGYPDGLDIDGEVLLVESQLYVRDVYSLVVANLDDVGIRLTNVQYLPSPQKIERQAAKEFSATEIQSQNITYDSGFDLIRHHTCDAAQSALCDPEIDAKIADAVSRSSESERAEAMEDVWLELYDLAPYAILYYQDFIWAYRNDAIADFDWLEGYSVTIRDLHRIVPVGD